VGQKNGGLGNTFKEFEFEYFVFSECSTFKSIFGETCELQISVHKGKTCNEFGCKSVAGLEWIVVRLVCS